jgi:transposase-like protein
MTPTTKEEALLLKTDVLGRVQMPAERREAILDAFEASGMSGQAFARHIGVVYSTFATWMQKRRRSRGDYGRAEGKRAASPVTLFEAVVESPEPQAKGSGLEVTSAQGLTFRIHSRDEAHLAAALLCALAKEDSC